MKIFLKLGIDSRQPMFSHERRYATVHEQGIVDYDHQRFVEQPFSVDSVLSKGSAMPEISRWCVDIELHPYYPLFADIGFAEAKPLIPSLTFFDRFDIQESSVFLIGNIAKIANEVHDLMIAEQEMHPAAGQRCLTLQSHDEVHHTPRLWTAIQQVTGEDEVR